MYINPKTVINARALRTVYDRDVYGDLSDAIGERGRRRTRSGEPMTGTELLPGASPTVAALAVIGLVLIEAALLYAAYGVLEDRLAPTVFKQIRRI